MAVKEKRRSLTPAGEAGDEIWALRVSEQELGDDAPFFEDSGHELEARALVAGRVRRVEPDQVSKELGGISSHSVSDAIAPAPTFAPSLPFTHQGDDRGWQ